VLELGGQSSIAALRANQDFFAEIAETQHWGTQNHPNKELRNDQLHNRSSEF